jgi:Protein of unknown function (DUF1592)/Protein of unknown function (DUF1588)/Protein of unknown function (DUF1585)/Protein of unknown function (DUF1595)/Protein of unknown function (DUF1587)/Planctomycete cytochrome C
MKGRSAILSGAVAVLCLGAAAVQAQAAETSATTQGTTLEQHWGFVDKYCSKCHNSTDWAGSLAFDVLEQDTVADDAKVWEEAVRRLRGALMPPPGEKQPDSAERKGFMSVLENALDDVAAQHPNPGTVMLHRLNRREYHNAIHELLDLDVDTDDLLPRDDLSDGFDNVAEVLKVTPAFLEQYFSAARQVSVAAVGNPQARLTSKVYPGSLQAQQYVNNAGLPLGTRGGLYIDHYFPVDGEYETTISGLVGGGYVWGVADAYTVIVTVDGKRVFQAQLGGEEDQRAIDVQQATGISAIDNRFRDIKFRTAAGTHRIGVTFKQKTAAEQIDDLHDFNPVVGMTQNYSGMSDGPRISNVEITGPLSKSGLSETPSRRKLFICHPASADQEAPCARTILATFARHAFRRPVDAEDIAGALGFYADARKQGDSFDSGIQKGVMAILSSPNFLFRAHRPPAGARPGDVFRIADLDLASRLSFFLWSGPPDDELIDVAAAGKLKDPAVLEAQVRRMLRDPRAETMVRDFTRSWLNVDGLDLVNTDTLLFPEYTDDLIPDFKEELYRFVWSVFGADRNVIDLMTADWTFLNERLAIHYGIAGVRGGEFRKVHLTEDYRRGLLGKGAILTATSYANRTSPVVRGAYILDHLMGTPPTSPPPGVSAFMETQEGGEALTVRHRLELHRTQKSCSACHSIIDPVGLALENYNAIGEWRHKDIDAGIVIDSSGKLADGTEVKGVGALRDYIAGRPDLFVQTLTQNLLIFALGRPLQYFDMPLVRRIVSDAAAQDYRFSALVLGIVNSPAFLYDKVPEQKPEADKTKAMTASAR